MKSLCADCISQLNVKYADGSYHESFCILNGEIDITEVICCNGYKKVSIFNKILFLIRKWNCYILTKFN